MTEFRYLRYIAIDRKSVIGLWMALRWPMAYQLAFTLSLASVYFDSITQLLTFKLLIQLDIMPILDFCLVSAEKKQWNPINYLSFLKLFKLLNQIKFKINTKEKKRWIEKWLYYGIQLNSCLRLGAQVMFCYLAKRLVAVNDNTGKNNKRFTQRKSNY